MCLEHGKDMYVFRTFSLPSGHGYTGTLMLYPLVFTNRAGDMRKNSMTSLLFRMFVQNVCSTTEMLQRTYRVQKEPQAFGQLSIYRARVQ